jgi:malate permease and related proteins
MAVFNQIAILFILILTGWAAGKLKLFPDKAVSGMSKLLMDVTMPALIISSMQRPFSLELLGESLSMLGISFAIYGASFAIGAVVPILLRARRGERGVLGYAIVFSNVGFMGFPVIEALYGHDAIFRAAIYNIPFNLFSYSLGAYMLARDGKKPLRFSPMLFVNPNVAAAVIGFVLFIAGITLPGPLGGAVELAGSTTTPLSMLLIGAMLSQGSILGNLGKPRVWAVSVVRLLVMPVLVYFGLKATGAHGYVLLVPAAIAAMPVAANTPIMAESYEADSLTASSAVTVSTLLSAASIPLIAAFLLKP